MRSARNFRSILRPALIVLAALVVAFGAAAAAAPGLIAARLSKAKIAERVTAWTGQPVRLHGQPVVTLFPSLEVVVKDVAVGESGEGIPPLARMGALRASLRLLPLLLGRVEVTTLTLVDPRINLVIGEDGRSNWSSGAAPRAAYGDVSAGLRDTRLGEIVLSNGGISFEDRRDGRTETVTAANVRLVWPRTSEPARLIGSFVWRGEMVDIRAGLDAPAAFFSAEGSPGRLTVTATPAALSLEGRFSLSGESRFSGDASLSSRSLRALAEWLGAPIGPGSTFGPMRISGELTLAPAVATLTDASLELDGNRAEGALTARFGATRPFIEGSLAFGELNLWPYLLSAVPSVSLANLLALPVRSDWLSVMDADVRASADAVDLGTGKLKSVAAALFARDGQLTLTIGEADFAGGRLEGELALAPFSSGVSARLTGRIEGVSLADAAGVLWPNRTHQLIWPDLPLVGIGAATFELAGNGPTVGDIIRSTAGVINLNVRDGSAVGVDVAATLQSLAEGKIVIPDDQQPFLPVPGHTAFSSFTAHIALADGIARADGVRLRGERVLVTLSGTADLTRGGDLEAEGTSSLFGSDDTDAQRAPLVELPFGVGGTLREPMVVPGVPRIGEHSGRSGGLFSRPTHRFAASGRGTSGNAVRTQRAGIAPAIDAMR